jgi:hypothetical protein
VYIKAQPVVPAVTIPIAVAIRLEITRLQDIEFETEQTPNDSLLQYMEAEQARGVKEWVTNF